MRRRRSSYWVSIGEPSTGPRVRGPTDTRHRHEAPPDPLPHHRPNGSRQTRAHGLAAGAARGGGRPAAALGGAVRPALVVPAAGPDGPRGAAPAPGPGAPGPPPRRRLLAVPRGPAPPVAAAGLPPVAGRPRAGRRPGARICRRRRGGGPRTALGGPAGGQRGADPRLAGRAGGVGRRPPAR